MIGYAMLPPVPAPGAQASAVLLALRQLERAEARLEDLRGAEPPPPPARRRLIGMMEIQVSADLARLLTALQEAGGGTARRAGAEATASYRRVLSSEGAPAAALRAAA